MFKAGEYEMKKPLEPLFFMGYYGEQQYLYTSRKNKNDDNKEDLQLCQYLITRWIL